MNNITHDWDLSPEAAVQLQRQLRNEIRLQPLDKEIRLIGGTDISFNLYSDVFYAGIIVLDYQTMQPVARSLVKETVKFPYVPGLLSFREIPTLLKAWENLEVKPDVVMVDGHGIAHPRRMGIATHFGLVTGVPTLGCAKKILAGKYEEPASERGSYSPILHGQEMIGYAFRTKVKVSPVFISPGHLMSFQDALDIVSHCAKAHKLPEPTRLAHQLVNDFRKGTVA